MSPVTDDKGTYWIEWLSSKDTVVHSKGSMSIFVRGQSMSYLDVTLSTKKIAENINNWRVFEYETLIEHKYICFQIHGSGRKKGRSNIGTAANKANVRWKDFKNTMQVIAAGNREVSPVLD